MNKHWKHVKESFEEIFKDDLEEIEVAFLLDDDQEKQHEAWIRALEEDEDYIREQCDD